LSAKLNNQANNEFKFYFNLASYNLLAPDLVADNHYLYKNVNPTYLDWNYRKNKIYQDVKLFGADVSGRHLY
jgi:mRNA deadenylase 3'-5' endonuclease subunit Ccr4